MLIEYKLHMEDFCNCVKVAYKRLNKEYVKNIYIFMNEEMKNNIITSLNFFVIVLTISYLE